MLKMQNTFLLDWCSHSWHTYVYYANINESLSGFLCCSKKNRNQDSGYIMCMEMWFNTILHANDFPNIMRFRMHHKYFLQEARRLHDSLLRRIFSLDWTVHSFVFIPTLTFHWEIFILDWLKIQRSISFHWKSM